MKNYVIERTFSRDTGIAVFRGIGTPDTEFARRVKTDLLSLKEAEDEAVRLGITFIDDFRRKGRIGAIGAVLWANRGIEAAGLYGESF